MQKLVIIVGPTASGKSELAVELAIAFNGEVISADSRQIYKDLDIGTGKITKTEMCGIPHHLLDVTNVKESFSVVDFKKLTETKISEISNRNKLPILAGGTGMYIQAVVDNIIYPEIPANQELRNKLEQKTTKELLEILEKLDSNRLETVDQKNPRRIIRAIEIAKALGNVPEEQKNDPKYSPLFIGIEVPRDELRERIASRTTARLERGWVKEVQKLHESEQSWKEIRALGLGYRCIVDMLTKNIDPSEIETCINASEWQYAKRQMNWFRRDERIHWLPPKELNKARKLVKKFLP